MMLIRKFIVCPLMSAGCLTLSGSKDEYQALGLVPDILFLSC